MESLAAAYGRLAPGRRVHGIAATLLPYTPDAAIDWAAFTAHVARTRATGLDVAVNMDTGFGDLLSPDERLTGAKHSSLDRALELRHLAARERSRLDFRVYTGNDCAVRLGAVADPERVHRQHVEPFL